MPAPSIIFAEDSGIDVTVPADNVRASKGDMRDNFRAASDSIEALQRRLGLAWRMALGDTTITEA